MNDALQQSVTNALPNHAVTASVFTASSWLGTLLGILTPIVGFTATVLGIIWMVRINRKKESILDKESKLLDLQIAEHRERGNAEN